MAIINYLPYGGVPAPEKIFKFEYTGEAVYSETGNDEWELEFDSSGSFTPYEAATVDIFIVGGGGGGSYGPIGTGFQQAREEVALVNVKFATLSLLLRTFRQKPCEEREQVR